MGTSDAEWPKMGRPPKKIDWTKFEQLCAEQCTLVEIALVFRVDPKTLIAKIKAKYGQTFSNVFAVFRMDGIRSLRSKQYHLAHEGNKGEGDKDMLKHLDKKYAHLQGDVDARFYGVSPEDAASQDKKIEISIAFVDTPAEAMKEKFSNENTSDEN